MSKHPLQIAIVYPGDPAVRRLAPRENNRFAALFAAFAAHGVDAHPAVYNREQAGALREQLLGLDGALVWVNPIEAGHSRAPLDALLREVAEAGVFISTHPDVIMKLGTKDVLVDTRGMGWGSDVHRLDTLEQLRSELGRRLAAGSTRVLKQWRGHSGLGVWRVQAMPGAAAFDAKGQVLARHAQRGSPEISMSFDEFVVSMAPYFEAGGHMVDQAWQPRLSEGMVRCYLVQDRVAGYGLQAVNALYPAPSGPGAAEAPMPGPGLYHPPNLSHLNGLKARLETEWIPELQRALDIGTDRLPCSGTATSSTANRRSREKRRATYSAKSTSAALRHFPIPRSSPLVLAAMHRTEAAHGRRP